MLYSPCHIPTTSRDRTDERPFHSLSTRMAALERMRFEYICSMRWLSPLDSRSAEKVLSSAKFARSRRCFCSISSIFSSSLRSRAAFFVTSQGFPRRLWKSYKSLKEVARTWKDL